MKYIALLVLFSIIGCSRNTAKVTHQKADNDTYVTSVQQAKRTHMLRLKQNILSQKDKDALQSLAVQYKQSNVKDIVLVPVVANYNLLKSYANHIDLIKEIFIRAGMDSASIHVYPPVLNSKKPSGIRIDSYTYSIKLPTAKEWKYDVGDIDTSKELPNFGLSGEYNLGMMIANPKDLVNPDPLDSFDGKSAVNSVRKIIRATNTGTNNKQQGTGQGGQQQSGGDMGTSMAAVAGAI